MISWLFPLTSQYLQLNILCLIYVDSINQLFLLLASHCFSRDRLPYMVTKLIASRDLINTFRMHVIVDCFLIWHTDFFFHPLIQQVFAILKAVSTLGVEIYLVAALAWLLLILALGYFVHVLDNVIETIYVCYAIDRDKGDVCKQEVHEVCVMLPISRNHRPSLANRTPMLVWRFSSLPILYYSEINLYLDSVIGIYVIHAERIRTHPPMPWGCCSISSIRTHPPCVCM